MIQRLAAWLSGALMVLAFFGPVAGAHGTPLRSNGDWCDVCQNRIRYRLHYYTDKFHDCTRYMCADCAKIATVCHLCRLPVLKNHGLHLPDGRAFCPEDAKLVVMDETLAKELFAQAKSDVQDILRHYPPLPEWNIGVHLVSREVFNEQYRKVPSIDDPERLLGLTISRRDPENEGKSFYDIYLLHGVTREQFLCVCAHEYTHTWLWEHEVNVRQLHKDTIEGFCELMAYKMAEARGLKREKERIMADTYSRGQFQAFEAADKQYRFYDLIRWVTNGVDSWLEKTNLESILLVREHQPLDPQPSLFITPPPPKTPQPTLDTLVLPRIFHTPIEQRSGGGVRRLGIIEPNDTATHRFFCDRV